MNTTSDQFKAAHEMTVRAFRSKLGEEGYREVIDGAGFMHSCRIKDIVNKRLETATEIFLSKGEVLADFHIIETVGFCNGVRYMINGESERSLPDAWQP
jgi:hypothetical protein